MLGTYNRNLGTYNNKNNEQQEAREELESHGIHESCSESLVLGKTRLESLGLEQDSTSNPGGQGFKGFVNLGLESRPPAATLIRP